MKGVENINRTKFFLISIFFRLFFIPFLLNQPIHNYFISIQLEHLLLLIYLHSIERLRLIVYVDIELHIINVFQPTLESLKKTRTHYLELQLVSNSLSLNLFT